MRERWADAQFRLLLKHLLHRFFNNEMLSVEGEILPLIMTVAGALAIPTLIAAVFLFPSYHGLPPRPPLPSFWTMVCEHYFYVVYSMAGMGLVTVFEADLLFPGQLDILILSPLPISGRRLVLARVLASLLFLVLFLLGMNSLGILAYPPITELHVRRLFVANVTAVLAAGTFSCAGFVALQGVLLCLLPNRSYRMASAWMQCIAVALLLTVFLSMPKMFFILNTVTADYSAARWMPSLWFLGLYECMLAGPARLPQFVPLAHLACAGTAVAVVLAAATYPLAYRRRVRQAIEGPAPESPNRRRWSPVDWAIHRLIFRTAEQRAVYHFLSQSLRMPTLRVYLAMYAGAGIALLATSSVHIEVVGGRIRLTLTRYALETILPAIAFWVVAGLSFAFCSSSDARAGWVFRVCGDRETSDAQLNAVRSWVAVMATLIVASVAALLAAAAHWTAQDLRPLVASWILATALCWILSDVVLFRLRDVPFVEPRMVRNTDLAFLVGRYIALFAVTLMFVRVYSSRVGQRPAPQAMAVVLMIGVHAALRLLSSRSKRSNPSTTVPLTDILPGLGLER